MIDTSDNDFSPEVTLIIPVFNMAAYLRECLQSIVEQDYAQAFEAILVDDCSTDGSADICREFSVAYPEIFVLIERETNGGVSVARNRGLEQVKGRYLMFVDPDDILPASALKLLAEAAERHSADIVKGNLALFDEISEHPAPDRVRNRRILRGEAVLTALYDHSEVRGHIGGKLLRRATLGDVRFPTGVRMAEDLLYFSRVFARAGSLVLIPEVVYRYRKHQTGSTGRKYESGAYFDWLEAVEKSGDVAATESQQRAHKRLMVRTMTQIAREARKLAPEHALGVVGEIERRLGDWKLNLLPLLTRERIGLRSILRYIRMRIALARIKRNLADF